MITYLQMFNMLKEELAEKAETHFKLDTSISQNGSEDPEKMDNYLRSEEEWQNAEKKYNNFLASISEKNIRPNDVAALN